MAKALLKAGLLEPTDNAEDQHPGPAWKVDGQAVFLWITTAGPQAIGVAADDGDTTGQAGCRRLQGTEPGPTQRWAG